MVNLDFSTLTFCAVISAFLINISFLVANSNVQFTYWEITNFMLFPRFYFIISHNVLQ